ncbi:CHY zinc finger protein [Halobacillus shinanisalinarum]|uniref:CHY zinc finger protein n=1 Tax=Halobacillus shinanisalinarum TaxID=2932258 RepID=A0ABY4H0N9_9BACI|nr:CHY zinc finger protein [Halobacillus shinanisalinarum]UOQ93470.1 CHY zinc finger protein [Halobacillus shinanisalinarum]
MKVKGIDVDPHTRCSHYHTDVDIIAIKFHCCNEYYACYACHQETASHSATKWPQDQWNEQAILCGNCQHELTINEYMSTSNCPQCNSLFNEKCSNHFHLYFDVTRESSRH